MRLWTEEQKEALRKCVNDNLSGDEASKVLSAQFGIPFNRSMVNGAAVRMGIHFKARARPPKKPKNKAIVRAKAELIIVQGTAGTPCTIWELTRLRCHYPLWPDNAVPHPSSLYCGAIATCGSYCEAHAKVTFRMSLEEYKRRRGGMILPALTR